jgi:hypothetical protein
MEDMKFTESTLIRAIRGQLLAARFSKQTCDRTGSPERRFNTGLGPARLDIFLPSVV